MPIDLKETIPLGRRLKEYREMFGINNFEAYSNILDCGGGPSSFNTELNKLNISVISIDPLYKFTKREIKQRIDETFDDIISQTSKNRDKFIWKSIKTVEELAEIRKTAMQRFLKDYDTGKIEKRYVNEELPELSFQNKEFDLALSSHFLFLYSSIFSLEFHITSIAEMLRVAREVRIFPLLDLNARPSPYLDPVTEHFRVLNISVDVHKVDYEFQKGGNEYLGLSSGSGSMCLK